MSREMKYRSEDYTIGEIVSDDGAFVADNSKSGYLTIQYPDGSQFEFISGGDIWVPMVQVNEWTKSIEAFENGDRSGFIDTTGMTTEEIVDLLCGEGEGDEDE